MLKEYPKFGRNGLENFYSKLDSSEQQDINEFLAYCGISAAEKKLKDIKRNIIQFRYTLDKTFNSIELKDLRDFLYLLNKSDREAYTKNGIKAYVKKFLKWKFKDWSIKFDELKDVKLDSHPFNEEKINSKSILKKEQIEKIIKAEELIERKAFFMVLYESGCRPIELRLLKWKDISFNVDGDLTELSIYATKTRKNRIVYIQNGTFLLQKLKEKSQGNEYVFTSPEDKNAPITKSTSFRWVQEMGKNVGIQIFPYLLRHSRATELYEMAQQNKISMKAVQSFLGHGKDMSDIYTHLSKAQAKAITKQVYQMEDLPPERKEEMQKEIDTLKKQMAELFQEMKAAKKINVMDWNGKKFLEIENGEELSLTNLELQ